MNRLTDYLSDPRFSDIEPFPSKVWLSSPTMHGDEKRWVDDAIETNWVSTVGANINEVERIAAEKVGRKYAVGLATGTAALHLAIRLCGEKLYGQAPVGHGVLEGRRVFASDMTFDATVNPIAYEGGEAVFIDTESDTWNMDPIALEKAFEIYPDVRLIVIAHLYGTPGKIDEIRRIANEHNALIVEDAAESFGATYRTSDASLYSFVRNPDAQTADTASSVDARSAESDVRSGAQAAADEDSKIGNRGFLQTGMFGDVSILSFNGNKIVTGSAGGLLLTDSLEDADKIRKWSTQSREDAPWYQHEELGYNYRMSNIIAGIIRGQLPHLEEHIAQKKAVYERYREGLKDLPVQMNPYDADASVPNWWLSCLMIDEEAMCPFVRSDTESLFIHEQGKSCPTEILEAMAAFNAEGRPIWKPMHAQPIYRMHGFITREGNGRAGTNAYIQEMHKADAGMDIFRRGLCLPSDNKMTPEQQDRIIDIIHRCFQ